MSAFLRGGNNNIDLELNNLHNLEDEIILEEQSKLDDIHQEKRQLQEKMKLRKERQTLLNLEIARLRALLADCYGKPCGIHHEDIVQCRLTTPVIVSILKQRPRLFTNDDIYIIHPIIQLLDLCSFKVTYFVRIHIFCGNSTHPHPIQASTQYASVNLVWEINDLWKLRVSKSIHLHTDLSW